MFVFSGRIEKQRRNKHENNEDIIHLRERESQLLRELEKLKAEKKRRSRKAKSKKRHSSVNLFDAGSNLAPELLGLDNAKERDATGPKSRGPSPTLDTQLSQVASFKSPMFILPAIEKGSPARRRKSAQRHKSQNAVSPRNARLVRKTQKELEEEKFNLIARKQLGITQEEIDLFRLSDAEGSLNSDTTITAALSVNINNTLLETMPHTDPSTIIASNFTAHRSHRKQKRRKNSSKSRNSRHSKHYQRRAGKSAVQAAQTAEALRRELTSSIGAVQNLTHSVRQDINSIRKIAPIGSRRARQFMHRWSVEKMFHICKRLLLQKVRQHFRLWVGTTKMLRMQQLRREYYQLSAANSLMRFFAIKYTALLRSNFDRWILHRNEARAVEMDAANYVHAQKIQSQTRIFLAKRHREFLIYKREHAAEWNGALRIQTKFRMFAEGRQGRQYMKREKQRRAATKVQAAARGRAGRKIANAKLRVIKEEEAARVTQQKYRSFAAKQELRRRRIRANQAFAASKVTAFLRGVRDRKRAGKLRVKRHRNRAATKIQVSTSHFYDLLFVISCIPTFISCIH